MTAEQFGHIQRQQDALAAQTVEYLRIQHEQQAALKQQQEEMRKYMEENRKLVGEQYRLLAEAGAAVGVQQGSCPIDSTEAE